MAAKKAASAEAGNLNEEEQHNDHSSGGRVRHPSGDRDRHSSGESMDSMMSMSPYETIQLSDQQREDKQRGEGEEEEEESDTDREEEESHHQPPR